MEQGLTTARAITEGIRSAEHLELVLEPDLSIVLFRRIGWSADRMVEWSGEHAEAGTVLIIPTAWRGESVFRICVVSPDTVAEHVLAVLDTMR